MKITYNDAAALLLYKPHWFGRWCCDWELKENDGEYKICCTMKPAVNLILAPVLYLANLFAFNRIKEQKESNGQPFEVYQSTFNRWHHGFYEAKERKLIGDDGHVCTEECALEIAASHFVITTKQ